MFCRYKYSNSNGLLPPYKYKLYIHTTKRLERLTVRFNYLFIFEIYLKIKRKQHSVLDGMSGSQMKMYRNTSKQENMYTQRNN